MSADKKSRKPEYRKKSKYLQLRLTELQKTELEGAATQAGLSISSWALGRLLATAREETMGTITPELQTLLSTLQQHRNEVGEVSTSEDQLKGWIGEGAKTWSVMGMVLRLRDLGKLKLMYAEGGGSSIVIRI